MQDMCRTLCYDVCRSFCLLSICIFIAVIGVVDVVAWRTLLHISIGIYIYIHTIYIEIISWSPMAHSWLASPSDRWLDDLEKEVHARPALTDMRHEVW